MGEFLEENSLRDEGLEYDATDEVFHLNGCCHGGCFVMTDMKFCPFCAATLKPKA